MIPKRFRSIEDKGGVHKPSKEWIMSVEDDVGQRLAEENQVYLKQGDSRKDRWGKQMSPTARKPDLASQEGNWDRHGFFGKPVQTKARYGKWAKE